MVPSAGAETISSATITMFSDPGDYIGGGSSREYDQVNATVSGSATSAGINLMASGGTSGSSFTFNIAPAQGSTFMVGYYPGAQRTPFRSAGRPGIDISGDGRGCNEVAGAFEIRDISFSGSTIIALDLLYEQHCEGGGPALFGEIQIGRPLVKGLVVSSSSITWPTTGPGGLGTAVPVYVRNPGVAPVDVGSVSLDGYAAGEFDIQLDSCSGQTLSQSTSCAFYVSFAPTAQGPRQSRIRMSIANEEHSIQLDGQVPSGVTSLVMHSDPGDYIGAGRSYNFNSSNALMRFSGGPTGIGMSLDGDDGQWWYLNMDPRQGQVLGVGNYPNATRYPFNGTGNGLSVYGNGRGCNNLTGSFNVSQAVFSANDNSLQHFSATFEQHCEGAVPALTGEVKYNSAPVVTPPPNVVNLSAQRSAKGLSLNWDNPGATDYRYTVIRIQRGSPAAVAPFVGKAVYAGTDTDALVHGLDPGATYTVTAFTVDQYGNVSNPARLSVVGPPLARVNADFGGNGTTDLSVFRPSNGVWFVQGGITTSWGTSGDIPVPGDYDGNGTTDVAVFRPSNDVWFVNGGITTAWGTSGDIPVPGDYDGNGTTDVAVFRPSNGAWFVQGGITTTWGTSGDIPVPGDYDGNGTTDVAVFRPSNGAWFVQGGNTASWGTSGDIPVPGDYDANGTTDVAVFRPSNGVWFVLGGGSSAWGTSGDVPAPFPDAIRRSFYTALS
ncbi:MAG TPA: hypothetical protein VM121_05040 [Acidimicrobiales bacterium]|nr:hypothetical protein [Acidimicrobiales bacterium]